MMKEERPDEAASARRQTEAQRIMSELQAAESRIQAMQWVSLDGRVIASMASALDADRVGAMSASLLALSRAAGREMELGNLHQVIINGEQRTVVFIDAGRERVLMIAADNQINLGRLLIHAQQTSQKLAALTQPPG